MIERFGADTGRVFELFAAPPEKEMDWTDAGAEGAYAIPGPRLPIRDRNVGRAHEPAASPSADRQALRKLHQTIQQGHGGFRKPLALQHIHRGDDGADERAVRWQKDLSRPT